MSLSPDPLPTSLYIHIPWCIKKCPYCDFNSHTLKTKQPFTQYINSLLQDFDLKYERHQQPEISSIFIGGGTPSLMPGKKIHRLLDGLKDKARLKANCEITLEANPGTIDEHHLEGYLKAGVNRLSIGVQSFSDHQLLSLGRIHSAEQAKSSIMRAKQIGFNNYNLDLMYGLPTQSLDEALQDLEQALEFSPPHLSLYQLTIEPNTQFYTHHPQGLPDNDLAYEMQIGLIEKLKINELKQYEVSAYAIADHQCQHNLNYWRFGDYIAIGAGAHGKHTIKQPENHSNDVVVSRYINHKHPQQYLAAYGIPNRESADADSDPYLLKLNNENNPEEIRSEFLMNALRLKLGFGSNQFERATRSKFEMLISELEQKGLIQYFDVTPSSLRLLDTTYNHLDDILARCMPG